MGMASQTTPSSTSMKKEPLLAKCGLGEHSFHQWHYCYKMRPVKTCTGYAECAYRSERERVVFYKRKAYSTWKKRWCFLYNDWEHAKGVTPERRVPTHFQTVVEKVGKKVETSTKKRRVPMLVPSEDILFRKHRKAEAEAIGCAPAIVAGEDRRLLPPLPTINPIFPPVRECIGQKGDLSSSSEGKDKEEVGSVPRKDLKVAMRPKDFGDDRLVMQVMAEYHDRLREAERCKLVNDARKTSKALGEAIQVKDQHFESLKRRNGENLRLTVQLKATKKQLETTMLEVSKVKGELDSALVEVSELKSSIPTEKEAAVKEFLGSLAFLDVLIHRCTREVHFEKKKWMAVLDHESGDEASADEQSHQGDDEFGDAENDVLQVVSIPWMAKGLAVRAFKLVGARVADADDLERSVPFWIRYVACLSSTETTASVPKASENEVSLVEVRYEVRVENPELLVVELPPIVRDYRIGNAESAEDVLPYEVLLSLLYEVVNCNDCIADIALPCRHWADQIKSPLGEGPRADHRSEGLGRGVRDSCVALILIT
ncbi:unnamed protein product [Malus baccata var. baccata]